MELYSFASLPLKAFFEKTKVDKIDTPAVEK
jgi:hypothetical protein